MKELWAPIIETPNYLVSTHGNVKHRYKDRFLTPSVDSGGYLFVVLTWRGKRHIRRVHRLVALTFLQPDDTSLEVNHMDGDKYNNHLTNLELVTHAQNMRHARNEGLMNRRRSWIRIVETGEVCRSISECARKIDGERRGVERCLSGLSDSYKGFSFEYM